MTPAADLLRLPYPTFTGAGAARLASSDQRIVVVGAGGWLGLATLEALHQLLGDRFAGRVVAFGSNDRVLALRGGLRVQQSALVRLADLPPAPTLVLHLAFLTQEKAKIMSEATYVAANAALSKSVLDALDPIGATGVFVASSGAAYMADDLAAEASKRLYGRLKLEDEARFAGWAATRGRTAIAARVFNLSGPYINKQSSYALACFIADALAGRPIAISSPRPVLRSYVAISELMSLVFALLNDAAAQMLVFDTAGDRPREMAEIADVVRHVVGDGGVARPALGDGPPDRYVGDANLYAALRHRFDVEAVDFPEQVRQTASFMAWEAGTR